jgi:hypothetical protein
MRIQDQRPLTIDDLVRTRTHENQGPKIARNPPSAYVRVFNKSSIVNCSWSWIRICSHSAVVRIVSIEFENKLLLNQLSDTLATDRCGTKSRA